MASSLRLSVPPRNWRLLAGDAVDAIEAIGRYTAELRKEQFFADRLRLDAVIKNLAVIGEAARRMPAAIVEANPQIPWSRMRAMRNVVVHEYFGIDQDVLWGTITDDLGPLVPLLAALLSQSEDAD
jgi:uncharacterized protein with HEPN domain